MDQDPDLRVLYRSWWGRDYTQLALQSVVVVVAVAVDIAALVKLAKKVPFSICCCFCSQLCFYRIGKRRLLPPPPRFLLLLPLPLPPLLLGAPPQERLPRLRLHRIPLHGVLPHVPAEDLPERDAVGRGGPGGGGEGGL